jgi:cobalt/nickel transport system ATP-binding protein
MPQQMNTLKTQKINRDAVAFGPLNLGLASEEVDERAMNTFSIAGATRPEDRTPYRLSGGKKDDP